MSKRTCLQCGTRNDDAERACKKCGQPMDQVPVMNADAAKFVAKSIANEFREAASLTSSRVLAAIAILCLAECFYFLIIGLAFEDAGIFIAIESSLWALLFWGLSRSARKDHMTPVTIGLVLYAIVTLAYIVVLADIKLDLLTLGSFIVIRGVVTICLIGAAMKAAKATGACRESDSSETP